MEEPQIAKKADTTSNGHGLSEEMAQDIKEFQGLIPGIVSNLRSVQNKSGHKVTLFHLSTDTRKPAMLSALDMQMLQGRIPFERMLDAEELATSIYIQAFKEKEGVPVSSSLKSR